MGHHRLIAVEHEGHIAVSIGLIVIRGGGERSL